MSGSDIHDFVQLGAEGQVNPTATSTPGALSSASLAAVTAQITTQTNPFPIGLASVVQAEQVLAVTGPNYYSPGQQNIGKPSGGGP